MGVKPAYPSQARMGLVQAVARSVAPGYHYDFDCALWMCSSGSGAYLSSFD